MCFGARLPPSRPREAACMGVAFAGFGDLERSHHMRIRSLPWSCFWRPTNRPFDACRAHVPLVDVCMFSSNLDDAWWCWTQISRSLRQSTRELMILKLTCTGRAPYNCKLQTRTYTFPPRPQTHAQCQLASERARMIQLQTPTRPRIPRCVCRASPSDHQSWSKHTRSRSYS